MTLPRVMICLLLAATAATAETRVRIEGLEHTSADDMLESLGGRLTHVRTSPASAPLADDAAFMLRQILRKDGYADVDVRWRIAGPDEVVLLVRAGTRRSLGTVTITGVPSGDARKLARLYARPAEKDRELGAGSPPFREEDVATGVSYVRQELNAAGYWSADVAIASRSSDPSTGAVNMTIRVTQGPAYLIGRPVVTSSDEPAANLATSAARPYQGSEATTANLNAMRLAVEEATVSTGYPGAKIRMTRTLADRRFIPEFAIALGTRVRLNRLGIDGLVRTHPERIARHMHGMEGNWYDEAAMNRQLRAFLATGAFSSARVETRAAGDHLIDATLHFTEGRARSVNLAAGFGTYQGIITRASYTDRNLFGNLLGFNSGIELGSRGLLGEVSLTDPWWCGTDVAASARGYSLIYNREGYSTSETGIEGKLSWKPDKHYTLDLLAANSLVDLREEGLPAAELGETIYTHPRVRATQSLEFRDNPVLPTRGWHAENPIEIGSAVGNISTSYVMTGLSGGWLHPLNPDYQIGVGGACAMLVPGREGSNLPIDLRLFNGGARSVRSFPERELGPRANGYPTGGEATWNTNAELIRAIGGTVKAVAFFDAGSLARNHEDIGSAKVNLAAGLGIRLDLPIGPIRLEYGYNLTRDPGEPPGTLHFAIGCAY